MHPRAQCATNLCQYLNIYFRDLQSAQNMFACLRWALLLLAVSLLNLMQFAGFGENLCLKNIKSNVAVGPRHFPPSTFSLTQSYKASSTS